MYPIPRSSGGGPITIAAAVSKVLESSFAGDDVLILDGNSVAGQVTYGGSGNQGTVRISNDNVIVGFTAGSLTNVTAPGTFLLYSDNSLASLSFPLLSNIGGDMQFYSNMSLASVSLPTLNTIEASRSLVLHSNVALGELLLPNLINLYGSLDVHGDTALETLSLPSATTIYHLNAQGCALLNSVVLIAVSSITDHLNLVACSALALLNLGALNSIAGSGLDLTNCTNLSSLTLTNLTTINGGFRVVNCNALAALSATNFGTFGATGAIHITDNVNMLSIDLGNTFIASMDGDFYIQNNDQLTTVAFPTFGVVGVNGDFRFELNDAATDFSQFEDLTQINGLVLIQNNNSVVTVYLQDLASIGNGSDNAQLTVSLNPSLTGIDLNSLSTINQFGILSVTDNPSISTLDIDALTTIQGQVTIYNNVLLNNLTVAPLINTVNGFSFSAASNALLAASVDAVLAAFNAGLAGTNSGTIDLSGGTNASPTGGAGNADFIALTSAGITVNIN